MSKLIQLQKKLKIKFKNPKLLSQALTHRSYLNETKEREVVSNERLEFLGDAILSFLISDWLYQQFPHHEEGTLTNLRSNLVRTSTLASIALALEINKVLFLSRGEKESGGEKNPSLLADALEALIGAIYLDQGLKKTKEFIKTHFSSSLQRLTQQKELKDPKNLLQEKIQAQFKKTPFYKTLKEEGPDHNKTFTVGVYSQGKLLAIGVGKSKQQAEEAAAQKALKNLTKLVKSSLI